MASRFAAALFGATVATLASALKVHREDASGSCVCLPFSIAYTSYGVKCGQGLEWNTRALTNDTSLQNTTAAMPQNTTAAMLVDFSSFAPMNADDDRFSKPSKNEKIICADLFERLYTRSCTRTSFMSNVKHNETSSWCYVGSKCDNLNGGARLSGTGASWKMCSKDEGDSFLSDKSPAELLSLSKEMNLDNSLLFGASYSYDEFGKDADVERQREQIRLANEAYEKSGNRVSLGMPAGHDSWLVTVDGNSTWTMKRSILPETADNRWDRWTVTCSGPAGGNCMPQALRTSYPDDDGTVDISVVGGQNVGTVSSYQPVMPAPLVYQPYPLPFMPPAGLNPYYGFAR